MARPSTSTDAERLTSELVAAFEIRASDGAIEVRRQLDRAGRLCSRVGHNGQRQETEGCRHDFVYILRSTALPSVDQATRFTKGNLGLLSVQLSHLARNVTTGYYSCMPVAMTRPSWDRLYQTSSAQAGYFTTKQAADAGFSTHLLFKHIRAGRVVRVRHGVYRLVHFPAAENEELAVVWLWSDRKGVFSHQTALALQGLSDVLPNRIHLTLPAQWSERRLRVPAGVALHYASVPNRDRAWSGPVPITSPRRTLVDCAKDQVSPDLLRQAAQQALRRGLVTKPDLHDVEVALEPFGGLAA